jgi:SAM-dependent methyltransferase
MERAVFDRMGELDLVHWWYVARRRILADLIGRAARPPEGGRILEIGCGTGHNFEMLRRFGRLDAIEVDGEARALASKRLGHAVGDAPLPGLAGVPERTYDLIALLDVLEHVDDDRGSLESIAARLAPGGWLLVTVPAYRWMWSAHDAAHHHKRRYGKWEFKRAIEAAGLELHLLTHFNTLLFPLAALVRLAGKAAGRRDGDDKVPPAPLNQMFGTIFGLERHLVGRVPLPFGVSLVAIASPSTR